jgi:hypothetical protein
VEDSIPRKLQYTLYIAALKEFNLDTLIHRFYWRPIKWLGNRLQFVTPTVVWAVVVPLWLAGVGLYFVEGILPEILEEILPPVFGAIGLLLVIRAFTERRDVILSWTLILLNHCWIALAVSYNEHFDLMEVFTYLSGVFASWLFGMWVLTRLKRKEKTVNLSGYKGHVYEHPRLALVFLLACLGLTGFPITPAFIGEDLIYSHIHEHQVLLAVLTSLSMVIDGIAAMRIYNKVFLGPHVKGYHETAFKSS